MKKINLIDLFYNQLKNNTIQSITTLTNKSVFLTLIRSKNTNIILEKSSLDKSNFDINVVDELKLKNYLTELRTDSNRLILTGKGLFFAEKSKGIIDENKIVNYIINDWKFKLTVKKKFKLSDKEKIILLSMVSVRSFSTESCIYLKEYRMCDKWLKIFNSSYDYLSNNGMINGKNPFDQQYRGNEHIVSNTMERQQPLKNKTNYIFRLPGSRKYYLDIMEGNTVSYNKLKLLLSLIIQPIQITAEFIDDFSKYCLKNSQKYGIELFTQPLFNNHNYDNVIKECLIKIL
ncbi:MAG: hypothetical protein H8E71_00505 [Candidatus Marinimicrobia bacterium]|nr:hypothetical protein [Candidatus Neomarinimicrobiota bacterium]